MQCALLCVSSTGWLSDLLFCCPDLHLCTLDQRELGLPVTQNPYGLRLDSRAQVAIMDTNWFRWIQRDYRETVDQVVRALEARVDTIVGLEGYDTFSLGMPPEGLDRVVCLLKGQGLFRDRDLYKYELGPMFPGASWAEKRRRGSPPYTDEQLVKLHCSLPCFAGTPSSIRRRVRRIKPSVAPFQRMYRTALEPFADVALGIVAARGRRPLAVHFVGGLTHVQRLEVLRQLRTVTGTHGITRVPQNVYGTRHLDGPLPRECQAALAAAADGEGRADPRGRFRFLLDLRRHRAAVAPAGYGELTFRHGEVLAAGTLLISQPLDHVSTMFPFRDRENCLYCKPDFSDLATIASAIESEELATTDIARAGRAAWRSWISELPQMLHAGLSEPICAAARGHPPTAAPSIRPL